MAFQYPPKPWQDGQAVRQELADGTVLVGRYNAAKNLWQFGRSTDNGSTGIITTADVYTLNQRPDSPAFPFTLTNDPADVRTQQEVNWWLYEHLGARAPIFSDTEPTSHPGYVAPDNELIQGDTWIDTSESDLLIPYIWDGTAWHLVGDRDRPPIVQRSAPAQHPKFPGEPLHEGDFWLDDSDSAKMKLYAWDLPNATWVPIGESGRPPIFSDTEPTEHPDFIAPDNQLEAGDIWYDTTDPDEIVQYIYDGTDWLKIGGDFVHRKGGDNMEGPLSIDGGRDPNVDGIVSTIEVLNVDSGQDSALHLKQNGATKVYVGKDLLTTATDVKFNANNMKVKSNTDTELFTMNSGGVFYEGAYTADKHIVTKEKLEEALENLKVATEDYYNSLVFKVPVPQSYDMPLLNNEQPHTWAGGGAAGELWFDIASDGKPFHIGFKAPTDLSPYDVDLAIKFTHDSGVMYARIASRWHSGQVHINLKDVVGDILVDGEQTTKIEVQDSIFVERAGDSMYGDLVIDDAKIEFPNIAPDATAIKMKRTAGEDATLIRLENSSASPNSANFYNIEMGGNSFYNGLQIKGGSGADEIVWRVRSGSGGEMSFFKEVSFENQTVKNVGTAVDDADAVPYGQVKQELQDIRDDLITELSFGTWRYQSGSTTPVQGRFYASTASVPIANADPRTVTSFNFNELDYFGNAGAFDRIDVGEMLVFRQGGLEARYRVNSTPATNGSSGEARRIQVNFVSRNQSFYFVDGTDWSVQLIELKDIDAGVLDDTYLRIDCDNSPLVTSSGLEIKTDATVGSGFGEAALTLNGKRDNNSSSAASIKFKNWNYDDSDDVNGYITYRTNGTAAGGFFRFNKNIDLASHDVYNVNALKLNNPGSIWSGSDERIKFKTASNGNAGSGLVELQRPGTNGRRGFAIRGKDTTNADADILFTFTNSNNGDSVDYIGRQEDNSNHLATTKYVKNYVDNNVSVGVDVRTNNPSNPAIGHMWYNTSTDQLLLRIS